MDTPQNDQHSAQVAAIAAAYLGNPSVKIEKADLGDVIRQIDSALRGPLVEAPTPEAEPDKPNAAAIRKSVTPDALFSFIDGRAYKALKRHLSLHGLTPQQYRERYGLNGDYPMTAPNYSAHRSALAKKMGLGQLIANRRQAASAEAAAPATTKPAAEPQALQTPARTSKRRTTKSAPVAVQADAPASSPEPEAPQKRTRGAAQPKAAKVRRSASKEAPAPADVSAPADAPASAEPAVAKTRKARTAPAGDTADRAANPRARRRKTAST